MVRTNCERMERVRELSFICYKDGNLVIKISFPTLDEKIASKKQ